MDEEEMMGNVQGADSESDYGGMNDETYDGTFCLSATSKSP
jgi:hypothetical protein